jgi:hypothetical protein
VSENQNNPLLKKQKAPPSTSHNVSCLGDSGPMVTKNPKLDRAAKGGRNYAYALSALLLAAAAGSAILKDRSTSSSTHSLNSTATLATASLSQAISPTVDEEKTQAWKDSIQNGIIPEELKSSSPEVIQQIVAGDYSAFRIGLYDSMLEDGDVVDFLVNGQTVARVLLFNGAQELVIPLPKEQKFDMGILGVHDGGGGVTLGFYITPSEAYQVVLNEGDYISIGVSSMSGIKSLSKGGE